MYSPPRRVLVSAAGHACELNMFFASRVRSFLRVNGYTLVSSPQDAEVILVSGCGAYSLDLRQGLEEVRRLSRQAPRATLHPVGCMGLVAEVMGSPGGRDAQGRLLRSPELEGTGLVEHAFSLAQNGTFGQNDDAAMERMFEHTIPMSRVDEGVIDASIIAECRDHQPADRLFVLISEGCIQHCAYCSIRSAKGRVRSRPIDQIVRTIQQGVERGFSEFILLADDCGSYGVDLGTDFARLVNTIVREAPQAWLHFYELYPQRLIDLFPTIDDFVWRRCFGMTAPLQHVSPRVLRRMGRVTDLEAYRAIVQQLRHEYPGLYLHNHFIYGYPTETREEFEALFQLTSLFHTVKYNRYRQTVVTNLPLQPEPEMLWREEVLRARGVVDGWWLPRDAAHRLVGAVHEVRKGKVPPEELRRALVPELEHVLSLEPDDHVRRVASLLHRQLSSQGARRDRRSPPADTVLCTPRHLSSCLTESGAVQVRNHALHGAGVVQVLDPEAFEVLRMFEEGMSSVELAARLRRAGRAEPRGLQETLDALLDHGLLVQA